MISALNSPEFGGALEKFVVPYDIVKSYCRECKYGGQSCGN